MMNSETITKNLIAVREKSPLIHNITNYVVMNNTANALLALGASPVMAHAVEEVKEMASIASALVLNMGTLSPKWVEAMLIAGETAHVKNVPVIFDPVGVGATSYRNETAVQILEHCKPDVVRGNASEIMALAKENITTKGVESTASSESAIEAAKNLAVQTGGVVVISGVEDFITDGVSILSVKNGSPLMPKVTGMGCTATAVVAAFSAVNPNFLLAAAHAMAVMGIAGELAAQKSTGPGTMQLHFLDVLYTLSAGDIEKTFKG
jgi:hydroxyethylthiazole kinase